MNKKSFLYLLVCFPLVILGACSDSNDNDSLELLLCSGAPILPERLFLQQLGHDSVIIKWRGNREEGEEASTLCFGNDMNALPQDNEVMASVTATGHSEARLTGLLPDTQYYYSIGAAATTDPAHSFRTSPLQGELPADGNTRIWIVGDSGVASEDEEEALDAEHVRDAYLGWAEANGNEATDLFLMLGDNAYREGTDVQHQIAMFDMYSSVLATTPVWPTIGNHEMGTFGISSNSDPNSYTTLLDPETEGGPDPAPDSPMPYLNIFTLPTAGEIGGIASGTEQYYSFDHANIHVVSLDSQLSARDDTQRAAMRQWLMDDLMATTADWTIVIFHHPPYTKGSHDSDQELGGIDQPIFAMREEFTPIFDDYGVDLVYGGHSHIYERSYYINGHTGLSDSFDPAINAELNDEGVPANGSGNERYTQIARNGSDDKVVYTVAGNGGKATTLSATYPHPAHFYGLLEVGSVVVDVGRNQLDASFIDANGQVMDSFTITR
jgi:hypothetical protein